MAVAAIPILEELGTLGASYLAPKLAQYGVKNADHLISLAKAGKNLVDVGMRHGSSIVRLANKALQPSTRKSVASYVKGLGTKKGFSRFLRKDIGKGARALSSALTSSEAALGDIAQATAPLSSTTSSKVSHYHQLLGKFHRSGKTTGEKLGLF